MRQLALVAVLAIALSAPAYAQQAQAPDSSAPALDARGIPVVSSPATAPAGANRPFPSNRRLVPAPNEEAVFAPEQGARSYPPCTAKVTDNCLQTYQRGVGQAGGGAS